LPKSTLPNDQKAPHCQVQVAKSPIPKTPTPLQEVSFYLFIYLFMDDNFCDVVEVAFIQKILFSQIWWEEKNESLRKFRILL
jgi:hypothetical protein